MTSVETTTSPFQPLESAKPAGSSSAGAAVTGEHSGARGALVLFAGTLFISALLLFAVQPMFTKMVLPRLGGSPSVWSTAMVAFQAFLFVGYLYAHLLSRWLRPARAAMAHLALLALVAATLPLRIATGFDAPPADGLVLWVIGLFVLSIGLPFAALSASAPLLQNWFIATGHPQAQNPYVLYAASNLGSFAALIAYPFLIEPFVSLQAQALAWSLGFGLLAVGICAAGFMIAGRADPAKTVSAGVAPTLTRRLSWMALTAIPAGLCIAVTAYISTDLAAVPFLWVIPLALYLLTFVGVFRDRPWLPHAWVLRLLPYVIAPLCISVFGGPRVHWFAVILLNLVGFTLMALACHGEAYRQRPEPGRLTEFYLWTSFGGVVGGVFAGIAAPYLFQNAYEYPVLLCLGLLMLPGVFAGGLSRFAWQAAPGLLLATLAVGIRLGSDLKLPDTTELPMQIGMVLLAGAILLQARKPAMVFGLVVLAFAVSGAWFAGGIWVQSVRSFFGVHRIAEMPDGVHRILFHGTTIHGAEKIRDAAGAPITGRPEPLTYYYHGGPISEAVAAARSARGGLDRVAVVGLGTGSLACHRQAGERWSFFEIDAEVIRLARDPRNFRFLAECGADSTIITGDARLTLAASAERFDLIVLDAFSSDSIPVHLLTREAVASYRKRLTSGGMIVIHVSNRNMELASVVAAVGAAEGLTTIRRHDYKANNLAVDFRANAEVTALAENTADFGDLLQRGWAKVKPRADVAPWTDDYADVPRAILRRRMEN